MIHLLWKPPGSFCIPPAVGPCLLALDLDVKGWVAAQSAQAWASLAGGKATQARAGGGPGRDDSVFVYTHACVMCVCVWYGVLHTHCITTTLGSNSLELESPHYVTPTEGNEAWLCQVVRHGGAVGVRGWRSGWRRGQTECMQVHVELCINVCYNVKFLTEPKPVLNLIFHSSFPYQGCGS